MLSYSCVTARLTMRSVLQTHGDSRSRSGPVIGLLPRPSMAPMLSAMPSTRKVFICIYIYRPCGEPSVLNPRGVGRCPKKRKVRGRLVSVTTTRGDHDAAFQHCAARQARYARGDREGRRVSSVG